MTKDTTQVYTVRDGQRQLKFDGTLLAASSSHRPGQTRWVEFELYRTAGGQYVLSRVGQSTTYHRTTCAVVTRNRLDTFPQDAVTENHEPCEQCRPTAADSVVCIEQPRYWAQVSDSAVGVVQSLKKFDDNGTEYLTNVAKRLLEKAAYTDPGVSSAYYSEDIA